MSLAESDRWQIYKGLPTYKDVHEQRHIPTYKDMKEEVKNEKKRKKLEKGKLVERSVQFPSVACVVNNNKQIPSSEKVGSKIVCHPRIVVVLVTIATSIAQVSLAHPRSRALAIPSARNRRCLNSLDNSYR